MFEPFHIGDGAYVHLRQDGAVVLTANHHNPLLATDVVVIDVGDAPRLIEWLSANDPATQRYFAQFAQHIKDIKPG
jgi:hypothetical protein